MDYLVENKEEKKAIVKALMDKIIEIDNMDAYEEDLTEAANEIEELIDNGNI